MVKRLHLSSARLRKNEHKHRESFITFLFVIKKRMREKLGGVLPGGMGQRIGERREMRVDYQTNSQDNNTNLGIFDQ